MYMYVCVYMYVCMHRIFFVIIISNKLKHMFIHIHVYTVQVKKREQKYCGCKGTTFTVLFVLF